MFPTSSGVISLTSAAGMKKKRRKRGDVRFRAWLAILGKTVMADNVPPATTNIQEEPKPTASITKIQPKSRPPTAANEVQPQLRLPPSTPMVRPELGEFCSNLPFRPGFRGLWPSPQIPPHSRGIWPNIPIQPPRTFSPNTTTVQSKQTHSSYTSNVRPSDLTVERKRRRNRNSRGGVKFRSWLATQAAIRDGKSETQVVAQTVPLPSTLKIQAELETSNAQSEKKAIAATTQPLSEQLPHPASVNIQLEQIQPPTSDDIEAEPPNTTVNAKPETRPPAAVPKTQPNPMTPPTTAQTEPESNSSNITTYSESSQRIAAMKYDVESGQPSETTKTESESRPATMSQTAPSVTAQSISSTDNRQHLTPNPGTKRKFRKRGRGGQHPPSAVAMRVFSHNPHTLIQLVNSSSKTLPRRSQTVTTTKTQPVLMQPTATNMAQPLQTPPLHPTAQAKGDLIPETRRTRVQKRRKHLSYRTKVLMLGYSFTSSVEECRNHLVSFGGIELITPTNVATILLMMTQTHTVIFSPDPSCPADADDLDESDTCEDSADSEESEFDDTGGPPSKDVSGQGVKYSENAPSIQPSTNIDAACKIKSETYGQGASSEPSTWKVDVFLQAVKELCPNFAWKNVLDELDNSQFVLIDRKGLELLIFALKEIIQPQISFPMVITKNFLYKRWMHPHGQFSLIQQVLMNQDILPISKLPFRPVITDALKSFSKKGSAESYCWYSLDLVNTLLFLSEAGVYELVKDVFEVPVRICPELLFLGVLQSSPIRSNTLRDEIINAVIPTLLDNLPYTTDILRHAWRITLQGKDSFETISLKQVISNAMSAWYTPGIDNPKRLTRLCDFAQDLKVLLDILSLPLDDIFLIELACLASRRELINLEKWTTFQLRSKREKFLSSCIKVLQRRSPQLKEGVLPENAVLGSETTLQDTSVAIISRMLNFIRSVPQLPEELVTAVRTIAKTYGVEAVEPKIKDSDCSSEPQKRRGRGGKKRGWGKAKKLKTSSSSENIQTRSSPKSGSTPTPGGLPTPSTLPTPGSVPTPGTIPTPGSVPTPGTIPIPGTIPTPGTIRTPSSCLKPSISSTPTPGSNPTPGSWTTLGSLPTPAATSSCYSS